MTITRDSGLATPLRRLWGLLRPYRLRVALALVAACVSAAAAAGYAWLVGPLLKGVLLGGTVQLGPVELQTSVWRWVLPAAVMAAALVKALAQFLQTGWMQAVGQRVLALLILPLYVPILIFGAGSIEAVRAGLGANAQLSLLAAALLATLVGAPLAAAAAVRIALD